MRAHGIFGYCRIIVQRRIRRACADLPTRQSLRCWSTQMNAGMYGSRQFCQRGSNFENVFLVDEGSKYHFKRAIIGPPAKRHLNCVSLACRCWPNIECWLGSFVIFQGIRTSIAKKPHIFVIFQRGSRPPGPPSGSAYGR